MFSGAELIQLERERQVETEGWNATHDDEHNSGQILQAAETYIIATLMGYDFKLSYIDEYTLSTHWPWDEKWLKVGGPIKNLVKAGALIAAEIDRLQRRGVNE